MGREPGSEAAAAAPPTAGRGATEAAGGAAATAAEAQAVNARPATAYASVNRTCELGMTRATGHPYQHLLEILDDVTRPQSVSTR